MVLIITYKSFKSREETKFHFHPFILKEFNNRWFLIGKKKESQPITNLALDRIISIDYEFTLPYLEEDFDADAYYKDVIGVTVNSGLKARRIEVWVDASNAPYVITKPLHTSQRIIKENEDGSIILNLFVIPNYEMERLLLGFGNCMEILKPEGLRNRMKKVLQDALLRYDSENSNELNA